MIEFRFLVFPTVKVTAPTTNVAKTMVKKTKVSKTQRTKDVDSKTMFSERANGGDRGGSGSVEGGGWGLAGLSSPAIIEPEGGCFSSLRGKQA